MWARTLVTVGASVHLGACADCNTEGCDALRDPARADGTGIGGIIAHQTDVVENDCQECGFDEATLEVWKAARVVASAEEAESVRQSDSPIQTLSASARYAIPLRPGLYLFCATTQCINASVVADATTTINVKKRYGPTSFFVMDEASDRFVENFGIEVRTESN